MSELSVSSLPLSIDRLQAQAILPRNTLVSVREPDLLREHVVIRLSRKIAYLPGVESLTLPDGWWQAFKAKHFDILLRWFPVRYRTYEAKGYLPEVDLPKGYGPVVARWLEVERDLV